jgi:Lrp/AsnC family transcriptional regulator, leucine-responsive regulatory protein
VVEAFVVTGHIQYVLRVVAPNLKHYSDFVIQRLYKVPGVTKVTSNILLKALKDEPQLHLSLLTKHGTVEHTNLQADDNS